MIDPPSVCAIPDVAQISLFFLYGAAIQAATGTNPMMAAVSKTSAK